MKKLLAILLIFAMVLPLCVITNAAETDVEIKPFNISTSLQEGFDNIWPKIHFWSRASEDYVTEKSILDTLERYKRENFIPYEIPVIQEEDAKELM